MKKISVAEFSKLIHVSVTKIYEAIRAEKFPATKEGRNTFVDIDDPLVKDFMSPNYQREAGKARKKTVKPGQEKKQILSGLKDLVEAEAARKASNEYQKSIMDYDREEPEIDPESFGDIPEWILNLPDSSELSLKDCLSLPRAILDKVKIYEQIKQTRTKTNAQRGELVDRRLVKTVFAKLYEIEMNQLIPLKEKLIQDLSSIFEIDDPEKKLKAGEKMDEELWKILANTKREMEKFLKKIGEDTLESISKD